MTADLLSTTSTLAYPSRLLYRWPPPGERQTCTFTADMVAPRGSVVSFSCAFEDFRYYINRGVFR